jgi:hypothetical protein
MNAHVRYTEIDLIDCPCYNSIMVNLDEIRLKFKKRQFEFSKHAFDQSIIRDITVAEIEEAVNNQSEVIEDYPDDKYGPSCLILGFTDDGRPLHVQCSCSDRDLVKIITVYQPNSRLWKDLRIRK